MAQAGGEAGMSGRYTGRLKRLPDGRLEGWLVDEWNWRLALVGEVDRVTGDWVLTGQLGEPPAALRVPAIDDKT